MDAREIDALPLHALRLDAPVDLDAHLRLLPKTATCKGLYVADALAILKKAVPDRDACELAGIPSRRYIAFVDYPFPDYLKAVVAAAKHAFPQLSQGAGIHAVGRQAYVALVSNQVGKILFGVLGRDFDRIAEIGAKGWQISSNFGEVKYVPLGKKRGAYVFKRYPVLLETLQTGVVAGALEATGTSGDIRVHLDDLQNGVIEMAWR
jgi:uncharacterized protein (TIGR02265 family)